MSIDVLQEKIRKTKTPIMLALEPVVSQLPPAFRDREEHPAAACGAYCRALLEGLKDLVPAVRISYACFAILGQEGLCQLEETARFASELGYYVVLDWARSDPAPIAEAAAEALLGGTSVYDALTLNPYLGSDAVRPYLPCCKRKKALFVLVKTPNRSGMELQELITGGRLTYTAVADLVSRLGDGLLGKYAFSQVAASVSANSAAALSSLRSKYKELFLLVDGYDQTGGNAKNCANAFDRLGRGAVVCAGSSVTCAWQEENTEDFVSAARKAVDRMKRSLGRYITVL